MERFLKAWEAVGGGIERYKPHFITLSWQGYNTCPNKGDKAGRGMQGRSKSQSGNAGVAQNK